MLAWGPVTHVTIAEKVVPHEYAEAFFAGTLAPDCRGLWQEDGRHAKLHSPRLVRVLDILANSPEKRAFASGYKLHVIADAVEGSYSARRMALGARYPADFMVDKLLAVDYGILPRRVEMSLSLKRFMSDAFLLAYPEAPLLTDDEIDDAFHMFNAYLQYGWMFLSTPQADMRSWYGDYRLWMDEAINTYLAEVEAAR